MTAHLTLASTSSAGALVERLLELPEARGLALDALLRLASIEWDDGVASACIECSSSPRMLLNPAFVTEHCGTTRKLAFLLLHELAHVSLGHSGLNPRTSIAQNIAFDALINASLLQGIMYPDRSIAGWDDLVVAQYRPDESPLFILRPPPGWPERPDWKASAHLDPALRDIHRRLYGKRPFPLPHAWEGVTYGEIVMALDAARDEVDDPATDGEVRRKLLGGHRTTPAECAAESGGRDHVVIEAMQEVMSCLPHDPAHAHSGGGSPFTIRIAPQARDAALVAALRTLLRASLGPDGTLRGSQLDTRPMLSVNPVRDRRAAIRRHVARALGAPSPVLFADSSERARLVPDGQTAIYLDVSGSMSGVLGPMHAALVSLRRLLAPKVFVFSTVVAEIARAEFVRGRVSTTGGTSVDPVLEHLANEAKAGRIRRAVLLTDGIFGPPSARTIARFLESGAQLHLGVTGTQLHRSAPWVSSATQLPVPASTYSNS